jgi:hypothetical protein
VSLRRLGILQWIGLLAVPAAWAADHVLGSGLTVAECNGAGSRWHIHNDLWQWLFLAGAVTCVALAEAAAVAVLRATRGVDYEGEPPPGRIRFFAIAAAVANVLFLVGILLNGLGAALSSECPS